LFEFKLYYFKGLSAMKLRILDSAPVNQRLTDRGAYETRNHLPLIARILLSGLFIWSGINKVLHPLATQEYMAASGIPLTGLFLIATIALEIGAGLLLFFGYYARLGAIALAIFLVPATLIFHTNLGDPMQQIMFFKNLAILGGLLMVVQYGPGNTVLRFRRQR